MKYLVISSSLNPGSKSRILANSALSFLNTRNEDTGFIDLQDYPLPFCDGKSAYSDANAQMIKKQIDAAQAIIVATPVYNYDVNAALKNLVELTGSAWTEKVVGFLCSAGGRGSYMSLMPFANSLMLDYRCLIVPRFVFATADEFDGDELTNPEIKERIKQLTESVVHISKSTAAAS